VRSHRVLSVRLLPVAAILLACGCTVTRTDEAPGVVRFSIDNTLPNNSAPPPAGLAGNADAISPAATPRSGRYAGFGYNIVDPGGLCAGKIRIYNFIVRGNEVSFGAYHGTIQPDGHLSMTGGPTRIYGEFVGEHFEGHFWQPGPACTYTMSLEPVS
jgi:hypothetical protein